MAVVLLMGGNETLVAIAPPELWPPEAAFVIQLL
jgi:hypothetical protein